MQTQPISPSAGPEQLMGTEERMHVDESPKKKSVIGKVKDKAKKLKTKIKKPKSPGAPDSNESCDASSSEDESGSNPPQLQNGEQAGEERDIASTPGIQGEALEAIPDPHLSDVPGGTAGVEQRIGHMSLDDKPDNAQQQEEPGVTPYSVGESPDAPDATRGIPVEEEKNVEGTTFSQETSAMDYDKAPDVLKTSDNPAACDTPTSEEKPLKDHIPEAVAGTAAATAGALGVQSLSNESENVENREGNVPAEEGILSEAKESAEEKLQTSESKPTITARATETVTSLKDTIAAKLGYGNKSPTGEADDSAAAGSCDPTNKSVLQKIQESAAGATGVLTSKLGYGDKPQEVSEEGATGDKKSYTQKAYDAAYGAKDAVAAKLGYGGASSTENPTAEGAQKTYLQKVQETAVGAKDAVVSKLGYAKGELPSSTESAYTDEQGAPASAAERFHPGEEDRALSQLITEKMSTGASTVKDTLLRPFGALKSGPPTPTTTPPPSSGIAVAEDPLHNTVPGTNDTAETAQDTTVQEKPGIVGKVTGAVSSLLGTTGVGQKTVDEASGKGSEDSQAANVEMY